MKRLPFYLFFLAFTLLASFVLLFKSRTLFELKTKSHYTNETNTCRIKDGDRQRDGQKSRNSANNFLESCSKLSVNFAECGDKMMRGKKKQFPLVRVRRSERFTSIFPTVRIPAVSGTLS